MSFPGGIRRLFCKPLLVKMGQTLRVNQFLKHIYYFLVMPGVSKKEFSFKGIAAQFQINTPQEFPLFLVKGFPLVGERRVLKKILQAILPGDVVYDIGASIGSHTIFMASKVGEDGQVIAFEPESHSFDVLQTNVILNSLKNVIMMPVALGDSFEEKIIYSHGDGLGAFNIVGNGNSLHEEIKIVPGDMLVKDENLPLPRVVKIDVEGYEYYVITGLQNTLSNKICKMVCCEIHPTLLPSNIKPNMVIDLLKSYGFNRIETHPRGVTFHVFCYKR